MRKIWHRPARRKGGRKTFTERFGNHLLAAVILVITVICGFFLSFPNAALQHRLEQELSKQLGTPVSTADVRLAFPGRLEIDYLSIPEAVALPLPIDRLQLSPIWSSVLADQPGWNFAITSGDGTIDGGLDLKQRLTAKATTVPLTLQLPGMEALTLKGTLANGTIDAPLGTPPDAATQLNLTMDDLFLAGLNQLTGKTDELPLGHLAITVAGVKGSYHVKQLQLKGGAIEASGDLTITPGTPIRTSRLSGNIILKPTNKLDTDIAALLPLLGKKGRGGDYRLRLSGTLASPRLR